MKAALSLCLLLAIAVAVCAQANDNYQAIAAFKRRYMQPGGPYYDYIISVDLHTLEKEKEIHPTITLNPGETWHTWSLDVVVMPDLQPYLRQQLPDKWFHLRVFYRPPTPSASPSVNPSAPEYPTSPPFRPVDAPSTPENPTSPPFRPVDAPSTPENPTSPPFRPVGPEPSNPSSSSDTEPSPSSSSESDAPMMCSTDVFVCTDETIAQKTLDCGNACGGLPVGSLTHDQVYQIMLDFQSDYNVEATMTLLHRMLLYFPSKLYPSESLDDWCIQVDGHAIEYRNLPDVYKGVRIYYTSFPPGHHCPLTCSDGTEVSCGDYDSCPRETYPSDSTDQSGSTHQSGVVVFWGCLSFALTSTCCCCYLRRRCRNKQAMRYKGFVALPTQPAHIASSTTATVSAPGKVDLPAEQFEKRRQQQQQQQQRQEAAASIPAPPVPMPFPMMMTPPHQMRYPFYQPMPMMNPYAPMMVQGPDGLWHAVPPMPYFPQPQPPVFHEDA